MEYRREKKEEREEKGYQINKYLQIVMKWGCKQQRSYFIWDSQINSLYRLIWAVTWIKWKNWPNRHLGRAFQSWGGGERSRVEWRGRCCKRFGPHSSPASVCYMLPWASRTSPSISPNSVFLGEAPMFYCFIAYLLTK